MSSIDDLMNNGAKKKKVSKKVKEKEEMVQLSLRVGKSVSDRLKLIVGTLQLQAIKDSKKKPYLPEIFEQMVEIFEKKHKINL